MPNATRISVAVLATSLLAACSTELDINAPYKDNTVVYGLLNMRDSVHFVKVNKAFLGPGSALVYAQIPDSNQYGEGDITYAKVFKVLNGNRVDSFPLLDTLITNRQPGTFYHPEQRLFYFRDPGTYFIPQTQIPVFLDQNADYELALDIRGRRIASKTPITNHFNINPVMQQPNVPINLVGGSTGYVNYSFLWTSARDCRRFEVFYRFNYLEVRGNDTIPKTLVQRMGERVAATDNQDLSVVLEGELFFTTLANAIPADPAVDKRIFTGMDFLLNAANDDFHIFLTLGEPLSGIVEERPPYSNLENALGIWGSRYNREVLGKRFNDQTLNELINGQYTFDRRFCSAFNSGPPYGCN
jgi:hypothetical protein